MSAPSLLLLLAFSLSPLALAQSSAEALLQQAIKAMTPAHTRATLELSSKGGPTYRLRYLAEGGKRLLIRVLAPETSAGQAFLINGRTTWAYAPGMPQAVKLPPGQKAGLFGSGLSLQDLAGEDLTTRYTAAMGTGPHTLVLTPAPTTPTPYDRLVITLTANGLLSGIAYQSGGRTLRTIRFSDYRKTGTGSVPLLVEVKEDRTIVLRYLNADFTKPVPRACFTPALLARPPKECE